MNTFYKYAIFTAVVFGTILSLVPTYGYPSGAPDVVCANMTPEHPPTTTIGAAPYVIKVKSNSYKAGVAVKGVISSATKSVFKGFLIEARTTGADEPYGTFTVLDSQQKEVHTVCGSASTSGLTHSNNTEKKRVEFQWMPPASPVGDLKFKLSVVESTKPSRYWLNIYSPTLSASVIY